MRDAEADKNLELALVEIRKICSSSGEWDCTGESGKLNLNR